MGIDDYDLLHSPLDLIVEVLRRLPRFDGNRIVCSQLSPKGSQPCGSQGKRPYPTLPLLREKTDHKLGGVEIHAKISHTRPPV
jgi:hypothetical protein